MVLIDDAAVKALSGEAQVKLGGQLAIAVGPLGREAEGAFNVSYKGAGMTLTYSISKGLFAGIICWRQRGRSACRCTQRRKQEILQL